MSCLNAYTGNLLDGFPEHDHHHYLYYNMFNRCGPQIRVFRISQLEENCLTCGFAGVF